MGDRLKKVNELSKEIKAEHPDWTWRMAKTAAFRKYAGKPIGDPSTLGRTQRLKTAKTTKRKAPAKKKVPITEPEEEEQPVKRKRRPPKKRTTTTKKKAKELNPISAIGAELAKEVS